MNRMVGHVSNRLGAVIGTLRVQRRFCQVLGSPAKTHTCTPTKGPSVPYETREDSKQTDQQEDRAPTSIVQEGTPF